MVECICNFACMCVRVCIYEVGVKSEASEEVKECCRKSHLLSAHSVKCRDMVNVIGEFSRRIYFRIQVLR